MAACGKLILRLLAGLLAAAAASQGAAADPPPFVEVAEGRLLGSREGNVRLFRGIPYALPPVGVRRWRPPAPPARWQGVREARSFGDHCVQPPYPATSVYFEPPLPVSEDCLTLNVWAPEQADGAPVLLWIHGGALLRGGSASPLYDGRAFADRGLVFVSINYRLGVLGWLAHPELSRESPDGVSGNYGLLDQIAALRWVRANIRAFGGDPERITVMGESAGALSLTYLLTSPLAQGLFSQTILQSANIRPVPQLREERFGLRPAERTGSLLAQSLGARTLADLRRLEAGSLVRAGLRERFVPQGTVDGHVLPAQVVESLDSGRQSRVPILAGFNTGEVRSQRALVPPAPESPHAYESEIRRRYEDLAASFLHLYPAHSIEQSLLAATRDAVYGWAAERLVRRQSAAGQPAFLYLFDHCYPAARARDLCAFHASELPFLFGVPSVPGRLPPHWPRPEGRSAHHLSRQMIDYWSSFARTGIPASPDGPAWPSYGKDQFFLRLQEEASVERDPLPGMFEFQEEVVRRRRLRGEPWFTNIGPAAPVP